MADETEPGAERGWLTPGVRGIGVASLLADLGHEIPTALLPGFLTTGLLAALAIAYAIRHLRPPTRRESPPLRIVVRPVLRGELGRLLVGVGAFEVGNLAATLMILRATELLAAGRDPLAAGQLAIVLYTAYNVAATGASVPAGRAADRFGSLAVLRTGVGLFALAYALLALSGPDLAVLAVAFVAAGVAIGCVETAEHAAVATLAPVDLRGSAFGLLAAIQSFGNFAASAVAGILWTLVGPAVAFGYAVAWMGLALAGLAAVHTARGSAHA